MARGGRESQLWGRWGTFAAGGEVEEERPRAGLEQE